MRGQLGVLVVASLLGGCSFSPGDLPAANGDAAIDQANVIDDVAVDVPPGGIASPRKLVFSGNQSTVDFFNFPVMVVLDASVIDYAAIGNPRSDLRFEDATGANIAFDIESWDPDGESIVWIRVPEILAGSTTTFALMHFGASAAGAVDPETVWSNWELVHHFQAFANSAALADVATPTNVTLGPGRLGNGAVFTGTGDERVTFPNTEPLFSARDSFTLSFWLYANYADNTFGGEPRVMDKGGPVTLGRLLTPGNEIRFQFDMHFTGATNDAYLQAIVPPMAWTWIAYTFTGSQLRLYVNGTSVSTFNLTGATQTTTTGTSLFHLGNNATPFAGTVDELRVEHRQRTPEFMTAQYLVMTRQFVTITDP